MKKNKNISYEAKKGCASLNSFEEESEEEKGD